MVASSYCWTSSILEGVCFQGKRHLFWMRICFPCLLYLDQQFCHTQESAPGWETHFTENRRGSEQRVWESLLMFEMGPHLFLRHPLSHFSLYLPLYVSYTSLSILETARFILVSGPLHLLFLLPGIVTSLYCFPLCIIDISMYLNKMFCFHLI